MNLEQILRILNSRESNSIEVRQAMDFFTKLKSIPAEIKMSEYGVLNFNRWVRKVISASGLVVTREDKDKPDIGQDYIIYKWGSGNELKIVHDAELDRV